MNASKQPSVSRRHPVQVVPFLVACLATLLALPVNAAIVFPDNPLQTGATVPPNIMFILDNSGSMALVSMPFDVQDPDYSGTSTGASQTGLKDNPHDRSYLNNTIYYDPRIDYDPWLTADGKTRVTGGTDVTKVFKSWNLADTSGGTRDLRDDDESIFYVPKDGVTSSTDSKDFEKYWVRNYGGTTQVAHAKATTLQTWSWKQDIGEASWQYQSISVPAGTDQLVINISGNTNTRGNADLYVKRSGNPSTGNYDYRDNGSGSTESVTINSPASGTWYIGVYNSDSGSNDRTVKGNTLSIQAISNAEAATPTGRSQSDELVNIATWYSYYRTRIKTAKGGASEAFASLGRGYRVGYTPINGRSKDLSSKGTGTIIPVDEDEGRFEDDADSGTTNRSDWYSSLQKEVVKDGSTPLRTTLDAVGQYYTRKDKNGPWADGTDAAQLSCRPSFSILTTDGYWNDSEKTTFSMGDEDKDGKKVTLADIAMHYYNTDLRGDLGNDVPPSAADPATWQHMATFSLSIGLQGSAALAKKYPDKDKPPASNSSDWPDPMDKEDADRIDDLWHAAVNGHGTFVAASNPTDFAKGLVDALSAVGDRTGSASNVSTNSTSFQDNSAVYQASYKFGLWIGEVQAFDASGGTVDSKPLWSASEQLPADSKAARTIVTWNGSTGVSFPTTAQKGLLARTTGVAPVSGDDNVSYIKGDGSLEKRKGGTLRDRATTVLGDIVDSSPAYSTDNKSLFVGANDGMLHAFDSETGAEQFAYVPAGLSFSGASGLAALSDPQYVHGWFVDGPVVLSSKDKTDDTTYLIGALGRGGKGLFALDVTNPSTFSATNVKWDKTGSAAPTDMGEVLGEPLIVKFNDGTTGLVVSNGVNSSGGVAALFVIDIADGSVIKEFKVDSTGGNGLSAPRGWDNDGNGTVDYVYAGDLKGNLWKFDLAGSSNTTWKVANSGKAMFVAKDAEDNLQPITAGLGLARDPATNKRWIFIGTGKFMETSDILDMSVQSMYGIVDDDTIVAGRTSGGDGDLQKREITVIDGTYRGFEAHGALDGGVKGWYIDLLKPPSAEGERIVNRPIVSGTVLITASMIPPTDDASCDAPGRGYINALDAFTGTSTNEPYFDANGDGSFTDDVIGDPAVPIGSVDLGVGMPTLPTIIDDLLVVGGSKATMGQVRINPQGAGSRRISWREILRD